MDRTAFPTSAATPRSYNVAFLFVPALQYLEFATFSETCNRQACILSLRIFYTNNLSTSAKRNFDVFFCIMYYIPSVHNNISVQ